MYVRLTRAYRCPRRSPTIVSMKHVIGIVAAALGNDPREVVVRARQLGFGGLLFDAFSQQVNLPELSQSGRREFRQLVASQDQRLIGLRADLGPKGFSLA